LKYYSCIAFSRTKAQMRIPGFYCRLFGRTTRCALTSDPRQGTTSWPKHDDHPYFLPGSRYLQPCPNLTSR